MTTPDPVVSVRDLRKNYGSFTALDGVSFDIARGETFALLGPNGAGKSTTIEILEGYRDRSGGDARVLGVDPGKGGQRRRVDVALGIIGRPELLFLDEPTTGFDPEARRQFWELIQKLKHEGTTILLTTHYLDEAAHLGDRAGVIAGGRLIDIGAIDELGGADARIPVVRWRENGVLHEERTTTPGAVVSRLGEPDGLEVIRPSLEDIYLTLVGENSTGSISEVNA